MTDPEVDILSEGIRVEAFLDRHQSSQRENPAPPFGTGFLKAICLSAPFLRTDEPTFAKAIQLLLEKKSAAKLGARRGAHSVVLFLSSAGTVARPKSAI
jgi:hypothetical protein